MSIGLTTMRLCPRVRIHNWYNTPNDRPVRVDTAAPATPSFGKGPRPKIRHGSRIRLIRFDTHKTRMATEASPEPRKIPLFRNSSITETLPPSMMAV